MAWQAWLDATLAVTPLLLPLLLPTLVTPFVLRRTPPSETMSAIGHLNELRVRLAWMVASLLYTTIYLIGFGPTLWRGYWVPTPALMESNASWLFERLAVPLVPEGVELVVVRPLDGFLAQWSLALLFGIVASAPLLLGHLIAFLQPALKPAESAALRRGLLPVLLLFLAGMIFAYVVVIPAVLASLYGFATALQARSLLQVSELISFTISLLVVFGVAFQTPLVMRTLTRGGLVEPRAWFRYWRHAIVGALILGALATDPSITSQVLVSGPLVLLYLLGAVWSARTRPAGTSQPLETRSLN